MKEIFKMTPQEIIKEQNARISNLKTVVLHSFLQRHIDTALQDKEYREAVIPLLSFLSEAAMNGQDIDKVRKSISSMMIVIASYAYSGAFRDESEFFDLFSGWATDGITDKDVTKESLMYPYTFDRFLEPENDKEIYMEVMTKDTAL